jgi:hypothetical protein
MTEIGSRATTRLGSRASSGKRSTGVGVGRSGRDRSDSENTIGRFEKKAGLVNGRRMSGREPSGELRVACPKLLKSLVARNT